MLWLFKRKGKPVEKLEQKVKKMPRVAAKPKLRETILYRCNMLQPILDREQQVVRWDKAFEGVVFRTDETPVYNEPHGKLNPVEFRITNVKGKVVQEDRADHLGEAMDFFKAYADYRGLRLDD